MRLAMMFFSAALVIPANLSWAQGQPSPDTQQQSNPATKPSPQANAPKNGGTSGSPSAPGTSSQSPDQQQDTGSTSSKSGKHKKKDNARQAHGTPHSNPPPPDK